MSKPKKPGTDLAALKARLAKKTAGNVPDDVPPPGQVAAPMPEVPPPGQAMAPPAHDVPPPGYVPEPAMPEVPPPGHVAQAAQAAQAAPLMADVPPPGMQTPSQPMQAAPMPQPMQAAPMPQPMPQQGADPYGGSMASMGGFDPDAGLIDGGPEIKPRGSKGIVAFAALLAAGIGVVGGWIGHKIVSTQDKIDQGKAKGEKMVAQVEQISEARKTVSLAMEDLKKDIAQDPAASAEKVTTLLTTAFDKQPQVSELFGWQLASVDPAGVKASFQLYEQVTDLQQNLSLMAKVLTGYGQVMKVGGPSLYGVTFGPSGAQMIAIADTLCGELPAEGQPLAPDALKSCGPDSGKAIAYKVVDLGGGEPTVVARGTGEGQAVLLLAEGKVYEYAIGIEQGNNAANFYKMALTRVEESLTEMNAAEEKALNALKKYAESPNVDGPPEGGEG